MDLCENCQAILAENNKLKIENSSLKIENISVNSAREILIVSLFVTNKRASQMMQYLEIALENKVKVIVVTRPVEDFRDRNMTSLKDSLDLLKNAGVSLVFKSYIHQKFAVMDQKIVWYGSINLLSFGSAEESIMRLESVNIANELIKSIERLNNPLH